MSATHESTARDYEREAEATRHRLADTLSELHDRLTPGDILNEVLSYGRSGGGAFFRAASTAAKDNPIPALLIGTGCAMFLAEKTGLAQRLSAMAQGSNGASSRRVPSFGGGQPSAGQSFRSAAGAASDAIRDQASSLGEGVRSGAAAVGGAVSDTASSVGNRVSSAATSVGDRISGTAASVGDAASSAAQQIRQGARQAGDKLSSTASGLAEGARDAGEAAQQFSTAVGEQIAETSERAREQATMAARQVKEKAQSLMEDQPLLVAAIALAVGAAIAAVLPSTKAEDEFLGETSDNVKETLAEAAGEQYQKAKDAVGNVAEQAKRVAAEEGLTPASAADVVRSVGDKVKRVVTETAASAGSELREKAFENKQT